MLNRCYNANHKYYNRYGGRGITVCDEWKNNFQAFYDWAISNGYRDDLTLDRKDNDNGYSPENCRWTTKKEQSNNRENNIVITYNGKTQTLSQWAEEIRIPYHKLLVRIKRGWSVERAFTKP